MDFEYSPNGLYEKGDWYLKLPSPFRLSSYAIWKRALDKERLSEENAGVPILAAWAALLSVAEVKAKELDKDNPGLDFAAWAVQTADLHIAEQVDPKK